MRTRSFTNAVILISALLGCADALFLSVEHYRSDLTAFCGPSGGCVGALRSAYGSVGPIPTALFGLGMYAVIVALAVRRGRALRALGEADAAAAAAYAGTELEIVEARDPSDATPEARRNEVADRTADVKRLDLALWLLGLAGFGVSWWLQYAALFLVLSFCPFCFASACLVTLICALATWDFLADRGINGETKLLLAVCGFIALMFGFVELPTVLTQYKVVEVLGGNKVKPVDYALKNRLIVPGMYVKGDARAPYTIVEFADYQCPACRRAWEKLDPLLAKYNGKYRLAFRNMPLAMHPWAHIEAEAAMAAGAQGKFWQMHDLLYKDQAQTEKPSFNMDQLYAFGRKVGLNADKFKAALDNHQYKSQVDEDYRTGIKLGSSITPTFFVITNVSIKKAGGFQALESALGSQTK